MKSLEFAEVLADNEKADIIKKGTEFNVYNEKNEFIGVVAVQRTTLVYLDMQQIPVDLLIGNYTFKEIVEE